jgi:hypothetical protein
MPLLKSITFLQLTNKPNGFHLKQDKFLFESIDENRQVPTFFKLIPQDDTILVWVNQALACISWGM